jgi:hypothetical protein
MRTFPRVLGLATTTAVRVVVLADCGTAAQE